MLQHNSPLAELLRPNHFDQMIGQQHLVGPSGPIRMMYEHQCISSMILWGPPGCGKTSMAEILSQQEQRKVFKLSAVSAGVKEVREVIEQAKQQNLFSGRSPILFIDEIHRFNKSQQDSLLHAVEKGWVVLIGATTENPSFEVVSALLSRCQTYILKPLSLPELQEMITRAVAAYQKHFDCDIKLLEPEAILQFSGGDGRKIINAIELVMHHFRFKQVSSIGNAQVLEVLQQNMAVYDKNGEQHYDIISAFIKSIRGSDPNAAVYWLARMLHGGEDVKFIARRLLILAAEDIGLANPNALGMAQSCFDAVRVIGMPEARIILSECAIYLAVSAKSNSAYVAINEALALVKTTGNLPVPLHLRNAPTALMKQLDYGKNYAYAHQYKANFVAQDYMPPELLSAVFYHPGQNNTEDKIKQQLQSRFDKYK